MAVTMNNEKWAAATQMIGNQYHDIVYIKSIRDMLNVDFENNDPRKTVKSNDRLSSLFDFVESTIVDNLERENDNNSEQMFDFLSPEVVKRNQPVTNGVPGGLSVERQSHLLQTPYYGKPSTDQLQTQTAAQWVDWTNLLGMRYADEFLPDGIYQKYGEMDIETIYEIEDIDLQLRAIAAHRHLQHNASAQLFYTEMCLERDLVLADPRDIDDVQQALNKDHVKKIQDMLSLELSAQELNDTMEHLDGAILNSGTYTLLSAEIDKFFNKWLVTTILDGLSSTIHCRGIPRTQR
jgi:hypothetical protein